MQWIQLTCRLHKLGCPICHGISGNTVQYHAYGRYDPAPYHKRNSYNARDELALPCTWYAHPQECMCWEKSQNNFSNKNKQYGISKLVSFAKNVKGQNFNAIFILFPNTLVDQNPIFMLQKKCCVQKVHNPESVFL